MRQCGRHIHGGREIRRAVLVERHLWMAVLSQIAFDLLGSCEAYSSEFLEICGVCHSWNVGKAEMVDGAVKRWTCQRKRFDCLHCFGAAPDCSRPTGDLGRTTCSGGLAIS